MDGDFLIIRGEAVRALGNYNLAGVFQRIAWRCERDGYWRVTQAEMADEVWLSLKTLKRCLAALVKAGWITITQDGTYDRTASYQVVWDDVAKVPDCPSPKGQIGPMEEDRLAPSSSYKTEETEETKDTDHPGADAPADPRSFDAWWALYPRKVGKGKALTSYLAALRKPGVTHDLLVASLQEQLPGLLATKEQRGLTFVPHPTTWLNQQRWADEDFTLPEQVQEAAPRYAPGSRAAEESAMYAPIAERLRADFERRRAAQEARRAAMVARAQASQ